jgi:hypothetical protein
MEEASRLLEAADISHSADRSRRIEEIQCSEKKDVRDVVATVGQRQRSQMWQLLSVERFIVKFTDEEWLYAAPASASEVS